MTTKFNKENERIKKKNFLEIHPVFTFSLLSELEYRQYSMGNVTWLTLNITISKLCIRYCCFDVFWIPSTKSVLSYGVGSKPYSKEVLNAYLIYVNG